MVNGILMSIPDQPKVREHTHAIRQRVPPIIGGLGGLSPHPPTKMTRLTASANPLLLTDALRSHRPTNAPAHTSPYRYFVDASTSRTSSAVKSNSA